MVEQKVRRRRDFQHGIWVRMGDGRSWMFPHPPVRGTDREYDALIRCLVEAEDADEARKVELALSILLLSRNYDPKPDEYEAIFSFGEDRATRSAAQSAICELIYNDLEAKSSFGPRKKVHTRSEGRHVFRAATRSVPGAILMRPSSLAERPKLSPISNGSPRRRGSAWNGSRSLC